MITTHHGDSDLKELHSLGLDPAKLLDFSVCVNPFGPSPRVRAALEKVALDRYPDRQASLLRRALADWLSTEPERILVGNGTSELIWLVCLAMLRPEDRVLILEPTYGEYARAAQIMKARVAGFPVGPASRTGLFATPLSVGCEEVPPGKRDLPAMLRAWQPRLVFLGNPNNPTGTVLPAERVAGWAGAFPDCLFVVDEAYLPFAEGVSSLLAHPRDNIVVLRSMTKDFALAGLRLGFAAAEPTVIDRLRAVQPPWSVNAMAQAAGVAALTDLEHVRRSCELLRQAKQSLLEDLRGLGLSPYDSAGHFFLLHVGNGQAFRRALLDQGMVVRDCASFGLPEFVRIATRGTADNRRLVQAIRQYIGFVGVGQDSGPDSGRILLRQD